jgi:hypothetical protein
MPAPLRPHLTPVVLHDEDAIPQGTVSNPLVVTATGGSGGGIVGTPQTANAQQDLALGALALTSLFGVIYKPRWVSLSFDVPLVAAQIARITLESSLGLVYNSEIEVVTLAPAATGVEQSYLFAFPPEFLLLAGDDITVRLSNTGGAEVAIVSATIRGESA